MARQLHFTHAPPLTSSQAGLAAITLLLCGFALFMCASHSRKWRRWSAHGFFGYYDHDPVIQLNNEAMMVAQGAHDVRDDSLLSGELWQKNILMGGKCQLPEFSGVIIYDSDGNIVTPARNPRPLLTWK